MILFYTGALAPNQLQNQPSLSLGGFISSSFVQNGTANNIFSNISVSDLRNNIIFTRMIVLKNTTGSIVNDVKIFSQLASDEFDIKIAAVSPGFDASCGRLFFEQLQSGSSLPFQATLEVRDEDNPITTTSFEVDSLIGIWISLQKKSGIVTTTTTAEICSTESIENLRENVGKLQITNFNLHIEY